MIEVIPAIDIIEGRCVRLSQGDYDRKTVYGEPLDMAKAFSDAGATRLHLVDLDGAKASEPRNLDCLEKIASLGTMKVEWGGGIKTRDALASVLSAGASYGIIGSVAALKPELFEEWLHEFGPGKLILGADVRDGNVAVNGWKDGSAFSLDGMLRRFMDSGLVQVICTDISKDGMLCGPSTEFYAGLRKDFPMMEFTVSGGVSCAGDISRMESAGLPRIIVGKAYYEGRVTIEQMKKWWQNA